MVMNDPNHQNSGSGPRNPPRNVALLDCAPVPSELIAVMHLQIIDAGEGLSRRYVANGPHYWPRIRESRVAVGTELADGMLGGQLFGPGGDTTPEYLD